MGSSAADLTSRILRRERVIVAAGIALLVGLSWFFVATGAGMDGPSAMHAIPPPFAALVSMWLLMMVAMMLPSTSPAILLYARVRQQRRTNGTVVQPWIFALGYLGVWLFFSILAAAIQQLVTGSTMILESEGAATAVIIGAGLYQLSSLKKSCLRQCRSPAQFLSRHWRPGIAGALRLGILHGAYCLGCCWMLMALLFVGGIMNFAWVAALTLIVAAEKLLPRGPLFGQLFGIALLGWGAARLFG